MALRTPPAFIGQLTISPSVNDAIYWVEDDGSPVALSTTISPGDYWPDALATAIATAMNTESAASGLTVTYSWSFAVATGIFSVAKAGGAASFYLKNKSSDAASIFTGGSTDTAGDTLSTGQYGAFHLGWVIETSYPSLGNSAVGAQACAGTWHPSTPPSSDSEEQYERSVIEAIAMDGSGDVYSFNDWIIDKDEFPLYGGNWQRRTLRFERLTQDDTTWYLSQFWGPSIGAGGKFRFYPDKTDSTYYLSRLTGEGLRNASRGVREKGYAYWSIDLPMRRAAT